MLKRWSKLAPSTRKRYAARGITPARYNAWQRTSKTTRARYAGLNISRDDYLRAPSVRKLVGERKLDLLLKTCRDKLIAAGRRVHEDRYRANLELLSERERTRAMKYTVEQLRVLARTQHAAPALYTGRNPFWYK